MDEENRLIGKSFVYFQHVTPVSDTLGRRVVTARRRLGALQVVAGGVGARLQRCKEVIEEVLSGEVLQ